LRSKTVSPFFWITGEGILGKEVANFPAVKEGLALYAFVNTRPKTVSGWENAREVGAEHSHVRQFHSIMLGFSAAKRNPMIQHLSGSESDGLGCFVPMQTAEEGLANVGFEKMRGDKFNVRAIRGDTLDTYLWRKATTQMIVSPEMMQLVPGMAMRFATVDTSPDGTMHGLFRGTVAEVLGDVTMEILPMQPTGVKSYKAQAFNRKIRRFYGTVLAATKINRGLMGTAGSVFTNPPASAYGEAPVLISQKCTKAPHPEKRYEVKEGQLLRRLRNRGWSLQA
jgi:hypothetical protein